MVGLGGAASIQAQPGTFPTDPWCPGSYWNPIWGPIGIGTTATTLTAVDTATTETTDTVPTDLATEDMAAEDMAAEDISAAR